MLGNSVDPDQTPHYVVFEVLSKNILDLLSNSHNTIFPPVQMYEEIIHKL